MRWSACSYEADLVLLMSLAVFSRAGEKRTHVYKKVVSVRLGLYITVCTTLDSKILFLIGTKEQNRNLPSQAPYLGYGESNPGLMSESHRCYRYTIPDEKIECGFRI